MTIRGFLSEFSDEQRALFRRIFASKRKFGEIIKEARHQQTNPSRKKTFHRVENVLKQLVHTSAVRSSRYEALRKFGEHSRS